MKMDEDFLKKMAIWNSMALSIAAVVIAITGLILKLR